MNKKISLLLAILMLVALTPITFAESETVVAKKANQKLTLDGKDVEAPFYNINGSNYIKLRDLAVILNETEKKFNISYDNENKTFIIERYRPYEKMKGDLEEIKSEKAKAMLSTKTVYINHNPKGSDIYEKRDAKTALINGNNYLQLRDLGELVGIKVGYDKETRTIKLVSDYKDETHYGFISKTFTEEDEKVFNAIESFYNSLAKNDKDGIYGFFREYIHPDFSDEGCANFEKQIRDILKNSGIKEIKEGYKIEKVIENYDDGKGYMTAFNFNDHYVALDYFKSNIDKTENQLRFVMNTGHDFTDGSLNSNYFVTEFDTGIRLANVFSLHDNFANKNYDDAYKNYQNLGLSGSKEEMIQFLNDKAKGRDIFHPKYTYRMAERRTFLTRGVTYTFDYGTDDQIIFVYDITNKASVLQVIPVKNPRIKK